MKENRKMKIQNAFLIYAVSGVAVFTLRTSALWGAEKQQGDVESSIKAMGNPFEPIIKRIKLSEPKKRPEPVKVKPKPSVQVVETVAIAKSQPIVLPPMSITGVIYDAPRPMAVINGRVYEEGQVLVLSGGQGETVLQKVRKTEIEVLYMNKIFVVPTGKGRT